ncbi:MAG: DUF502 domain-containing protein [Candidatus Omnitrophica bacterium]|nr:DUF502 domain-containing protein [Candidatus Omnitrophota bacterium]
MLKRLRRYFFSGLLIILPIFFTAYILVLLFKFFDGVLGPLVSVYFEQKFGFYVPGAGLILFIIILLFAGFLSTHFLGRVFARSLDGLINKFPLLRSIYFSFKTITEFLFSDKYGKYKKVVLIEFPHKGCWSVGFVTNEGFKEAEQKTGRDLLNVYIPLVPTPTSGFLLHLPREEVIMLDMSIKDALQLVISAGVINPQEAVQEADKRQP